MGGPKETWVFLTVVKSCCYLSVLASVVLLQPTQTKSLNGSLIGPSGTQGLHEMAVKTARDVEQSQLGVQQERVRTIVGRLVGELWQSGFTEEGVAGVAVNST